MNSKLKIFLVIIIVLILGAGVFIFLKKDSSQTIPTETEQPIATNTPIVKTENPINANSNLKTYRNEEWGFEFEYPNNWVVSREIKFANKYSKYIVFIANPVLVEEDNVVALDESFGVNIVSPDFVKGSFWESQKVTKVIVGGVEGDRYEYKEDGSEHATIILPFGGLRVFLTTGMGSRAYMGEFNHILSSFRFVRDNR